MDPHVEGKLYRMFLEVEGTEKMLPFLRELGGRVIYSSRGPARRGFHKIEIRERIFSIGPGRIYGESSTLFLEVPARKAEKMIMMGWTP